MDVAKVARGPGPTPDAYHQREVVSLERRAGRSITTQRARRDHESERVHVDGDRGPLTSIAPRWSGGQDDSEAVLRSRGVPPSGPFRASRQRRSTRAVRAAERDDEAHDATGAEHPRSAAGAASGALGLRGRSCSSSSRTTSSRIAVSRLAARIAGANASRGAGDLAGFLATVGC